MERVARIELAQSGRKHDILAIKLYPHVYIIIEINKKYNRKIKIL